MNEKLKYKLSKEEIVEEKVLKRCWELLIITFLFALFFEFIVFSHISIIFMAAISIETILIISIGFISKETYVEARIQSDGIYFVYGNKNSNEDNFQKITSKYFIPFNKIRNIAVKEDIFYIYKGFNKYYIPKRAWESTEKLYEAYNYVLSHLDSKLQKKLKGSGYSENNVIQKEKSYETESNQNQTYGIQTSDEIPDNNKKKTLKYKLFSMDSFTEYRLKMLAIIGSFLIFWICSFPILLNDDLSSKYLNIFTSIILLWLGIFMIFFAFILQRKDVDVEAVVQNNGIYFKYGTKNPGENRFRKIQSKHFVPFNTIRNVVNSQNIILIFQGLNIYLIPKRAFENKEEFFEFYNYILTHLNLKVQKKIKYTNYSGNHVIQKYKCLVKEYEFEEGINYIMNIPVIKRTSIIARIALIVMIISFFVVMSLPHPSDLIGIIVTCLVCVLVPIILGVEYKICGFNPSFSRLCLGYNNFELEIQEQGMYFSYDDDEVSKKVMNGKIVYVNRLDYVNWSKIKSLYKTPESIFVSSKSGWHCIPKSAFGSDTEYEDFYNLISSYARK
ncbi:MAG: hypothetical protein LUG16_08435 [Candidatus Gastranaerophilales bacterium]|nr:hypothetical protein [Candidatus Gastranaerophilales bacterium]